MSAYLVDYENVNSSGLNGLTELDGNDKVYIFYSDKANTLTFDAHRALNESSAQIEYMKVAAGEKNALDFQLSTFLGYLVAMDGEETYYVVSNDEGYSFVELFWKEKGVNIERTTDIQGKGLDRTKTAVPRLPLKTKKKAPKAQLKIQEKEKKPVKEKKPESEEECTVQSVMEFIPQYQTDAPMITEYLNNYKTKQGFNNALMKVFGGEKTKEIYGALKPLLVGKKGK